MGADIRANSGCRLSATFVSKMGVEICVTLGSSLSVLASDELESSGSGRKQEIYHQPFFDQWTCPSLSFG